MLRKDAVLDVHLDNPIHPRWNLMYECYALQYSMLMLEHHGLTYGRFQHPYHLVKSSIDV